MKLDQRFWVVRNKETGNIFVEPKAAGNARPALYSSEAAASRALGQRLGHRPVPRPDYIPDLKYGSPQHQEISKSEGLQLNMTWRKYGHPYEWVPRTRADYEILEVKVEVSNGK